jgi:hypothetical protein
VRTISGAVCQAIDVLPARVSPADVAEAERRLVGHASKLDAGVVTKLGQRIADYLNPDGLFTEEDLERRRWLRLGPQGPDGMSRLSGLLDPEARAYLEAIEGAVRPGRHQPEGADRGQPVTVVVTTTLAELDRAAHAVADPAVPMPAGAPTPTNCTLPAMPTTTTSATDTGAPASPTTADSAGPTAPARRKSTAPTTPKNCCAETPTHPTRTTVEGRAGKGRVAH